MPTQTLTPTVIGRDGGSESFTAMNTTDTFKVRNTGRTFLHFKKTGAGIATITFTTPVERDGLAVADVQVQVPATTGDVIVVPVPTSVFNDGSGYISFTADEATGLTVAAVEMDS